MKKLICILLAAATTAGCEKDDPTRYDMSQGRVCFPGAAPNETAEYPGYSNSDSTFYASMTFKQQPEGVAEAVIEVPVKLIGGASGSDRKIGVRVLEEGTTAQPGQYEILGAEVPAGKTYGAIRMKKLDLSHWTLINFFGRQDYEYLTNRGKYKLREGAISGLFSNDATMGGIKLSFVMSLIAAALACLIVVIACNYIFKNRNKKSGVIIEYCLLFPWLLPTILICYSYRVYFNSEDIWYVGNMNLYYAQNVRLLIIMAYTIVKLPFSLRMIKASFYAIDEELEDAAKNLGASSFLTFIRVKLPIILPSVLAVFALNFNALFTEYDMSATFASSYGTSYAMVIQSMCAEEGLYGYNVNASGRRCASTVFIMIVSGIILYLVYGVGARDLGERLEAKERRRKAAARVKNLFHKKEA